MMYDVFMYAFYGAAHLPAHPCGAGGISESVRSRLKEGGLHYDIRGFPKDTPEKLFEAIIAKKRDRGSGLRSYFCIFRSSANTVSHIRFASEESISIITFSIDPLMSAWNAQAKSFASRAG